jgi:hypothetical protein
MKLLSKGGIDDDCIGPYIPYWFTCLHVPSWDVERLTNKLLYSSRGREIECVVGHRNREGYAETGTKENKACTTLRGASCQMPWPHVQAVLSSPIDSAPAGIESALSFHMHSHETISVHGRYCNNGRGIFDNVLHFRSVLNQRMNNYCDQFCF